LNFVIFLAACEVKRTEMGLPEDWNRVESWLNNKERPKIEKVDEIPVWNRKNPEIPTLSSYNKCPDEDFWKLFPSRELPKHAETNVDGEALQDMLLRKRDSLTEMQFARGMKTVNYVKHGADCAQSSELPACMQKNAKNAVQYGDAVTDTVATWIKQGFVAGPFNSPPMDKFRVNCLMAIAQETKIRPVLNGSLPEGNSLNSNVDSRKVEKVSMCSARCFSYSVIEAGKDGIMSKMDMLNAYKNIPCVPSEYRLQGFHWLGKYFIETRQIFGAKTAVCNFDVLGNTILQLTLIECGVDRGLVHRQLDDVPVVVPAHKSEWNSEFVKQYKQCCDKLGVGLAENDPKMEKAFSASSEGKVLGIIFNTQNLSWRYPEDKKRKALIEISKFLDSEKLTLLQMQQLMGRLNDISLMMPFLKSYKGPLNEILGYLQQYPDKVCAPSIQSIKDIMVWSGFLLDKALWSPISHRPTAPPISHFSFTSDAAGIGGGEKVRGRVGVGVVGFDTEGEILFANQTFWPDSLADKTDSKGAKYGSKTLLLEAIGLLIPLLIIPEKIKNSHVVFSVDNIGCYYGWTNKNVQGDKSASVIFRSIAVICAFLEVNASVRHLPRLSTWEASLCDRLSRDATTTEMDRRLLRTWKDKKIPLELMKWLENPSEDWDLPIRLLEYVKNL